MTPLIVQRGVRTPLIVVVMFSWLAATATLGQNQAPASQPAEKDQKTDQSAKQPTAKPVPKPTSQPVVRPVEPPSSAPATYPATPEAQERFRKFREMRQAAVNNGHQSTAKTSRQPASQPEGQRTAADQPKASPRRPPSRTPAEMQEIRRRALESRDQRQVAARKVRESAQSQPAVDEDETPTAEPEPVATSKPATTQPPTTATQPEASPAEPDTPPAEPEEKPVEPPPPSADGRDYFISFVDMEWEDVIAHYAKLVGKPLMMEVGVSPFGELTYESPRRFTKEEMRDELNFLLLQQEYFIVEKEDYVYLVPTSELTKELELDRVFDSVAAFEAAKLRDLEICSVLIQIKDRPAEQIRDMLSPSMPDRALPVVIGNTNTIKITGLARDVRRFQGLLSVVETEEFDPRETRFIKVETNVRQIEQMVREYFKVSAPKRQYDRETRQFVMVGGESPIVIIPDERTKNLIVKATPAKLAEVEKFIKEIDQAPDLGEFKTTVIPVQYGSATDIAKLLNDILQQEQGQQPRTPYRPPTRTTPSSRSRTSRARTPTPQQAQPAAPEDIIVEDIYERAKKTVRIVADERTNNLVVYANEDGLKRVKEILDQIDRPVPSNFRTFRLEHAEAEQIQPTIEQIARGTSPSGGRGRTSQALSIVADATLNALHVVAEREDMNRIETIIQQLDVEAPEDQWHFVELTNITASEAASMIAPVLDDTGAVRRSSRGGRRAGPVRATATSKTIPLDEANTLIVICSDEEWEKAEKIIKIADESAISNRPEIQFFTIENGNPQTIASTVSQLYANYQHPVLGRSRTFVDTLGQQIVVQGIKPALEEIESLVKSLDIAVEENPIVILQLEHADASDVAEIAQGLLPPDARGRGRRGVGGPGASVQADLVTNSLIIQADRLTVDRIKAFVAEREAQVAAQKPERRYYSLKNAAPRDVVSAISSLFGGTTVGRRGRAPVGTQVKTVIVGSQVVVDAPAGKQAEVAALVEQLDELSDKGVTTLLIKLPGADVRNIAGRLSNAFRDRVRQQDVVARFEPDTTTETILMTCSKDVLEEAGELLSQYEELTSEHIWKIEQYQLKHASANDASSWLQGQITSLVSQQMSSSVVRQIKVTADMRTNRIFINAPELAAKQGLLLLEQYDTPVEQQPEPPMDIWTIKLPGLDVRNLSSQLRQPLNDLVGRRTDRLRASVTADQLTSTLIISAPSDMKPKIDELIGTFSAETEDLTPVQKFIQCENADANYIANQVHSVLGRQIERKRGRGVAQQISIEVDTRLNRIILSTPKFAVEMAESLIAELDQPPTTESQLQTIELANADAGTVNSILQTIFREKIRSRTLQISIEPLTNSLIVGASKEDFEEIKKWALDLDEKAKDAVAEQRIFELKNANPWEVNGVLQETFVRKGRGRTVTPGKEVKTAIIAGRSIFVTAPPEKMEEIGALITKLDEVGQDEMVVRKYSVPGFGTQLNQLARQIQDAVNRNMPGRERPITVTPVPAVDTLIVTATEKYLPEVEKAMEQFKDLYTPPKIETILLQHADANTVLSVLRNIFNEKIRAGKVQLSVETMTNTIVMAAAEADAVEIRDWVAKFDAEAEKYISPPKIIKVMNANPWEVANVLTATFVPRGASRRQAGQEISFQVMGGRNLLVKAPAEKMKQIEELVAELDATLLDRPEVRTYVLAGMGNRIDAFARQLQGAMNQQVQARERRVSITSYSPADALIVTAMTEQFEQIEQLMEQLKPLMVQTEAKTEFFQLEYVDASQIVGVVQDMVQRRATVQGRRGSQDFSVLADPRTNRLIVFAPEAIMEDVRVVVTELDIDVPDDNVVVIVLEYADPSETRNMINDMFGNRGRRHGESLTEQVYVTVSNNTLIVKAPPKKLELIQELLAKVDKEDDSGLQIKTYDLKVLNAQQVATQVQMFLRSMGRVYKRGQMQPGAFAEPTTNTLVVIAPADHLPFIETLLTQIEAKTPDEAVMQTYVLNNARADQVQGHVDQMLRAKVAEREGDVRGRRAQQRTVVVADPETNRLFVFAPPDYQELAAELITIVDEEVDTGEIVHIIPLENGDATQVAQTVTLTMQGGGVRGRGTAPMKVKVVPDVGSNSILLAGLPKDVAEIESLVKDLEVASDTVPELQYFTLEFAQTYEVAEALRGIFPPARNIAESVTITEDDYYNRLLVSANKRKMRQVEAIVQQLDTPPDEAGEFGLRGGRELYFIKIFRGDPFDIAWDVSDLLPPEERGGPVVEADLFGQYIRVMCRPSEYPQIERLIHQFDKRAKPEIVFRAIDFLGDRERLLEYLQARELDYDLVRPPTGLDRTESIIIELHPEAEDRTDKRTQDAPATSRWDGAAPHLFGGVVLTLLLQDESAPEQMPAGQPDTLFSTDIDDEPLQRQPASLQMLPDGRLMIHGPRDAVEEIEDAIALFEEDLSRGEVIRIFRFRYGDVNAASRILDMMFNERQIRVPQARQQQPQQQQRGRPGREGEQKEDQPQSMVQQIQQMIGGREPGGTTTGGQRVRIATDASHNYLIVKCDEGLLPDITQLLRELDIAPAEVDVEVIQLKNLEATETANNIKEVLGITKAGTRRPTPQASRGRSPQQQLMEMIQQQMVSVGGEVSAKIESVEIVPNSITNSLLVSAPKDVMTIIKDVITRMEGLEGGDVTVIKHYPLTEAKVDDVLPLLQDIFGAAGGVGGRGPRGGGGSPADLGPVTISGDPRSNTIIYVCQAKDVETVNTQIEKLDIEGAVAEVEMYVCKYGDAVGIAEVVREMFATGGPGGAGARGARGRGVSQVANLDIRISAEPATNTILVFAPEEKRELIIAQIEQLDRENRFDIREIPVVFAKPDRVADKLLQIFGGTGGSTLAAGPGGRGGARRQATQTPGRIVVIPDESAKKLLVRAPDEIFAKMQEITELLDQPSEQLLIRTFPLRHADATIVVDSVKAALAEFMQIQKQLGGEELDIDAFTAIADPRTNSVVVVGSEETFLFVEQVITAVDGDVPADREKQFRIFVLDRSDAQTVADAINSFAASGGTSGASSGRRGGQRGGLTAGVGTTGPILDVQAIADPTTNSVMVYGRADDIAKVEEAVINELEDAIGIHRQFATIEVKEAVPTQLITYIQPFLDETAGGGQGGRGPRGAGAGTRPGPRLIGNDNNGTIVVHGSERQIEEVRSLVARFDNKDITINQFEIIPVPWGQDAFTLASTVQDLVNRSEQDWADRTGREPRLVTVNADEHSNAIIAFGDPSQTALVKTVVAQLHEIRPEKPVTRVVELVNLSSAEAQQLISDLQQRRSSGGSIRGSSRSGSSPRRSPSRSGSSSQQRSPSGSGSRGRGWNWSPPSPNGLRYSAAPAGFATPVMGTTVAVPRLVSLLVTQDPEQTDAGPEKPAEEQEPPTPREEQQQQMLSSISGQLRGEVVATPLDSRRIIVTGDANDVDFIVQMLAMMEASTPAPVIEVFTLANSKAAAIAPVLDETMRKLTEIEGGGDRVDNFSIIAEGRSNSLIVSASETNMDRIAELIEKLDFATDVDTQPKLVPLKHIRAAEAFELLEDPIKRLNDIREVPANAQATIQAVDRSNAILIVGTPADISEIEKLIAGIDVELPPDDDFTVGKIYVIDLKNAQAEDLAETLTELIEMEKASSGRGGQAGASRMPLLRKLILTTADGRELPPIDLDKPIVIFPEKGKNSLIIFSSEKNSEALLEIVSLFDSLPIGEEVEVKSFVLRHANAEQVGELLQTMFDDAKKALKRPSEGDSKTLEKGVLPPVPPGLTGRGLPYNVVVSHDVRSNTVIVIGRKDAVLLAAALVNDLDRPSLDLALTSHVLQLRNIQASTIKEKLDDLLKERLDALGGDKNEARDSAIIQADDRSNALIVLATREIFRMVEDLALQLDESEPYSVVDSEFRRLTYADAAKLAGLLQELFDKKKDADRDVTESGQKNILYVFADARSNSLMLTGTRDYLLEANDLVDNLDQAFDPTVQFKLHTVRLNSAANIATLLKDMIDESRRDQSKEMQGTPIHVAADPYSNNLLLAASQEDMLMLERWIEVLDRPAEVGRVTRIIPLRRGAAEQLAQSAQNLFETKAQGSETDVTVTHDETTNSIIAIGPPAVVNDIEDFITKLNAAEGAGAVVKIFKLEQADAEDAGELLRSILEGKGGSVGGGSRSSGSAEELNQVMLVFQQQHPELGLKTLKGMRAEIVVIDDLRTNSLVVTAPPDSMGLVESLVKAIDVPPDAAKIRVFRLRNSDAEEMVTMLEELFEAPEAGGRGGGGEEGQEMQLTLGEGIGVGGRQQLAFTVDIRTNSVIAAGTTGYLDLVEELILKLDTQPIEERKTIVFQPLNNEATAIQQAINEYNDAEQSRLNELKEEISVSKRMERDILTIASEDTNRIILDYDPRRESDVLELVRALDQPPPQVMIQVLIVEVTMDNSLELGVEFAFQDLQWSKAGPTDTTTFDFIGGTDIGAAGTGLGGFTFTITGADFNFLIRTLQNEGSLNVLSRPQIVAMDNQEAHIKITNDVPYASGSTVTATGIIQTTVSRREVGIELTVTPHINPDGFVRMEIVQTVSDITGSTVDVGQGVTSPIFLDREAETVVTVKDNETVVLGGLITTRDEQREQKVPFLGDIPLFGWLARNESTDSSRTELLVILTPRVVRTIEDYRELSFVERDRTGYLPDEVLSSELMSGLRVAPEDLAPAVGEDMLGPFPKTPQTEEEPDEEFDEEIYGPTHSSASGADDEDQPADADSYDVPISWAGYDSKWADRRTGQH